jgi:hypothetical protein
VGFDLGNTMKIRINWPLVVLVLGVLGLVLGTLLVLMLRGIVTIDTLKAFGVFVLGIGTGGALPLANLWKQKRVEFQLDSDPPKSSQENGHVDAEH